jgi:hypothetical protein
MMLLGSDYIKQGCVEAVIEIEMDVYNQFSFSVVLCSGTIVRSPSYTTREEAIRARSDFLLSSGILDTN